MARPPRRPPTRQVGELMAELIEPVLARKAGMTLGLLSAWPEIVGPRLADATRPERLAWPSRPYDDAPFQPAQLVIACEGAFVLRLQHEAGEIVQRVNGFFGYHAVDRIRIVQRPVARVQESRKPKWQPPDAQATRAIARSVENIENPRLRRALERYGACVLGRNRANDV
ncbi:DUF721 domain-containing protein [Aureimonas frigidaquae]|uniref:DUF721 domain-containing protein n=1 Tax=Aureimonas frigidaquae TaxID=424757 RepID=UPI00078288AF|nr:DciA family protein [Aureimonas frigidaquae]